MIKWANQMLGFIGYNSGGVEIGSSQRPGNINQDTLYLAVPTNTTSAEWTAICLGKQKMLSTFATANAAGDNFQTLNVIIHVVS